jgi:hypothetical protein
VKGKPRRRFFRPSRFVVALSLAARLYTHVRLISFRDYVIARGKALQLCEGDEGRRAFIDSQNQSFKDFLRQLLVARKITDPRLVQEGEALVADQSNSLFNYGQQLLKIAAAGRGRLAGGDVLQGATEAAGRMWELLWRPEAYAGAETWESRFPLSAQRGGIRGTVKAVANNLIGHFAQRLRKGRASVSTVQTSQVADPGHPFDAAGRASNEPGEWEEWRAAIIQELENDLRSEEEKNQGGKHGAARIRNLRWAIAIADRQMAIPYQWRSMPEVMAEIPELQGIGRGGLQQTLKNLIDDARNRVVAKMGGEKEQAVARRLQARGRRALGRTQAEEHVGPCAPFSFGQYVALREGLVLPDTPARARMTRINPFPATQRKLNRLFPVRPAPMNVGGPPAPLSPVSLRPTPKPIPSPLQAAWDGFAGFF